MITIFFKGVACLLVVAVASAQERDDWPRTFTGQPDFVFTKQEVLADHQQRAENGEDVRDTTKLWSEVLDAEDIHPFRQPRSTLLQAGEEALPEVNLTAYESFNVEDIEFQTEETAEPLDLDAIEEQLAVLASQTARKATISLQEVNPKAVLAKLRLQTIVTSPKVYAQINGKRLEVGETIFVPIQLVRGYAPVEHAVKTAAPASNNPSETLLINGIVQGVLKRHRAQRALNPALYRVQHEVAVTISNIEPRAITVDILGQQHSIGLNYLF